MKILGVRMHDRVGDDTDFVEFDLKEVNYIDLWKTTDHSSKVPAFHTNKGSFLALSTIKDIASAYYNYGFRSFDRSTVINVNNIKEFYPERNGTRIIFIDQSYVKVRKKLMR